MKIESINCLLAIIIMFGHGYADAGLFQSCDEEWKDAWGKHGVLGELPEDKRPGCAPTDPYLAKNKDGKIGHEKQKELAMIMDENRNLLAINGYEYSVDMGKLYIAANVFNGTNKTLKMATLKCRVVANNAIELYDGPAELEISLISGGRANVPISFGYSSAKSTPSMSELSRAIDDALGGGGHPALDTMGYRIDELGVECEKIFVF